MELPTAINILELHNKWRRDNDGKYKMANPKELGEAIDVVVSNFKARRELAVYKADKETIRN